MKKVLLLFLISVSVSVLHAQGLKGLIKKVSTDSSVTKVVSQLPSSSKGLSNEDIISGLKEALTVGTNNGTNKLSMVDGFFKDAALKILMPTEAQKVEKKLRDVGLGKEKMPIVKQIGTNVFCAVRMSGMGVALAPVVAQEVSEMIKA